MLLTDKITLGTGSHGESVVCVQDIQPQERLIRLSGPAVDRPNKHTIQRAEDEHLTPQGAAWAMINHACAPNCTIDYATWELIAHRSIRVGEEITFNYLSTEWELATPFSCTCGAAQCAGEIRGFRHLDPTQRDHLRPLLSPFLASRLLPRHPTSGRNETS